MNRDLNLFGLFFSPLNFFGDWTRFRPKEWTNEYIMVDEWVSHFFSAINVKFDFLSSTPADVQNSIHVQSHNMCKNETCKRSMSACTQWMSACQQWMLAFKQWMLACLSTIYVSLSVNNRYQFVCQQWMSVCLSTIDVSLSVNNRY